MIWYTYTYYIYWSLYLFIAYSLTSLVLSCPSFHGLSPLSFTCFASCLRFTFSFLMIVIRFVCTHPTYSLCLIFVFITSILTFVRINKATLVDSYPRIVSYPSFILHPTQHSYHPAVTYFSTRSLPFLYSHFTSSVYTLSVLTDSCLSLSLTAYWIPSSSHVVLFTCPFES